MTRTARRRVTTVSLSFAAAWLLLTGAAAGQQSGLASVPSLGSVPSDGAALPDGREVATDGRASRRGALRVPAALPRGSAPRAARSGAASRPREPVVDAASVLRAVFALGGSSRTSEEDLRDDLGSLGDVLPGALLRDLVELRARVQRYRAVLFGERGIARWGDLEDSEETARIRLNLQADPHPGFRVTLVTG